MSNCFPMDCSLQGSSVHGILQARILEWVAILFFRGFSKPRDQMQVSCIINGFFTIWAVREALHFPFGFQKYFKGIPSLCFLRNWPIVLFLVYQAPKGLLQFSSMYKASLVAQLVKNPTAMQETWAQSLGWEDPLEKGMATHCSILGWRIPWTEEPCRLQSMGLQRVRHDWMINTLLDLNPVHFYMILVPCIYFLVSNTKSIGYIKLRTHSCC